MAANYHDWQFGKYIQMELWDQNAKNTLMDQLLRLVPEILHEEAKKLVDEIVQESIYAEEYRNSQRYSDEAFLKALQELK